MDFIKCEFIMKKLYEAGVTPENIELINLMEYANCQFDIFLTNSDIVHIIQNY